VDFYRQVSDYLTATQTAAVDIGYQNSLGEVHVGSMEPGAAFESYDSFAEAFTHVTTQRRLG
jgi:hypothetical protein